ncbi:MAG: DUF952 domain-containing protein [Microthrixaceae bacterium]
MSQVEPTPPACAGLGLSCDSEAPIVPRIGHDAAVFDPTTAPDGLIYHVTRERDWDSARPTGAYRLSTREATLAEVGFIHGSFAHQVRRIGTAVFGDTSEPLVVLVVDPERLDARVVVENLEGGEEGFPHIYGPIPTGAVVDVLQARIEHGEIVIDGSA